MHRSITSKNVEDYSSHVPGDEVAVDREEDIEYTKGVMTHSAGVSTVKMMPQVMTRIIFGSTVSDAFYNQVEFLCFGGI